jgi:rod shape-determining protein MreC
MARGGQNRSRLLIITFLVTALLLLTLDLRGINIASGMRGFSQTVLSPFERIANRIFSPIGSFFGNLKNLSSSNKQIDELKSEVEKLKLQAAINEDVSGQLNQLRNVLDLASRAGYQVVSARVINQGVAAPFKETIKIDVGASSGIEKNMTVINGAGLVGVVKSVSNDSAIVLLMSDPTFKVGVRIASTQSVGVLSGEGGDNFIFQLLDPTGEIKEGDVLIARGSDGGRPFVPGVPVGIVTSIITNPSAIIQTANVKALANLNSLGIISVVTAAPKNDPRDSLVPKIFLPRSSDSVTATTSNLPAPSPTPSIKR